MINITPIDDLKEHIDCTTCECNPTVEFENGEMLIIHNSYDGRELTENHSKKHQVFLNLETTDMETTISDNTQLFINGYNKGELTILDLNEMLETANKEDEFELATSLKNAIELINN